MQAPAPATQPTTGTIDRTQPDHTRPAGSPLGTGPSGTAPAGPAPSRDGPVHTSRQGGIGILELRRTNRMNALDLEMVAALRGVLDAWAHDPRIHVLLLRAPGGKVFSAGGDVRAVRARRPEDPGYGVRFFDALYSLMQRIHEYPKPIVTLMDGITMGAGLGLAMHSSHRIAGDHTCAAMPETAIGFFTDVGATWMLPRLPGAIGMHMALTGARMGPADTLYTGLATHYVPTDRMAALVARLAEADWQANPHVVIERVISDLAGNPGPAPVEAHRPEIDRCYGAGDLAAIRVALAREGRAWAQHAGDALDRLCPTSLKVTRAALLAGIGMTFADCMAMETRICHTLIARPDFDEGVRAQLVDKDKTPRWNPDSLTAVCDRAVRNLVMPCPADSRIPA